MTFPASVMPGTKIWITALWANAKAQTGPPATPVFAGIGFEGTATNVQAA
jgi:hypothetical protein